MKEKKKRKRVIIAIIGLITVFLAVFIVFFAMGKEEPTKEAVAISDYRIAP
jgi:flagellar basal body-associated protein FliL